MGKLADLSNKQFGKLTARWPVGLNKRGYAVWLCSCSCGNMHIASNPTLQRGTTKSCGCLKFEHSGPPQRRKPYEHLYQRLIYSANKRKFSTTLTYDDFLCFTEEKFCHYCGVDIEWSPFSKSGKVAYYIDRKNQLIGYEKHNIVVSCVRCNLSRGDRFSYEEWKYIGNKIKEYRGSYSDIKKAGISRLESGENIIK